MKKQLSKSEVEAINKELKLSFNKEFIAKKQRVELLHDKAIGLELVLIDTLPWFFKQKEQWIPHLKLLLTNRFLKKVSVDTGAIPFIVKGADIMRPGIVSIDENILANEIVVIIDQTHSKPLAVGKALFSSTDMLALKSGKCVQNLHFVGDKVWQVVV